MTGANEPASSRQARLHVPLAALVGHSNELPEAAIELVMFVNFSGAASVNINSA